MLYTFSSIEKEEYGRLYEFVKNNVSFYSISYIVVKMSESQTGVGTRNVIKNLNN